MFVCLIRKKCSTHLDMEYVMLCQRQIKANATETPASVKGSTSAIFCQLAVNRNCNCTHPTATQTPVGITKQSVTQSTGIYRASRCKLPFGQLRVDDLSFSQKNSWIHPCVCWIRPCVCWIHPCVCWIKS